MYYAWLIKASYGLYIAQYSVKEGVNQVYSRMVERLEHSRAKLTARDAMFIELKQEHSDTIKSLSSNVNVLKQDKLVPKLCPLKEHLRGN